MKCEISEKTLEINISYELLKKKYKSAFIYGPTLRDEKDLGYDISIEGAEGYALFIQFKAPKEFPDSTPKTFPYWFDIKKRQHNILVELAKEYPESVQYAFPLIGNHKELQDALPNLSKETYFYTLKEEDRLLDEVERNKAEVSRDQVIFHSQRFERNSFNGYRYLYEIDKRFTNLNKVKFQDFVKNYNDLLFLILDFQREGEFIVTEEGEEVLIKSLPVAIFVPMA